MHKSKNQETDRKPSSLKRKSEMKMMKAVEKLKFWSRKKKKKKAFSIEPPPPPPPPACHCQHYQYYHYQPIEPSAPPLPLSSSSSWVDCDHQTHEAIFSSSEFISITSSSQAQVPTSAPKDSPVPELSPLDPSVSAPSTASYQQYMVPNPVYGVPTVPQKVRKERGGGAFGCVFAIGAHLFHCFFPCFHIREVKR